MVALVFLLALSGCRGLYVGFNPSHPILMHFSCDSVTLVIGTLALDAKDSSWINERCGRPVFSSSYCRLQVGDSISNLTRCGLQPDSTFVMDEVDSLFTVYRLDECRKKCVPSPCGGCSYEISGSIWNMLSPYYPPIRYVDLYVQRGIITRIMYRYDTHD
jgi:hypothetical protein